MHHITSLPSVLVSLFCLLLLFNFLFFCVQGSLEHCLHQYHLLSLLLSTVCCLDLLVMSLFFIVSLIKAYIVCLFLWLFLNFSLFIVHFYSCCGAFISTVHQHELDAQPVYYGCFLVLGVIRSSIFL